MKNIFLILLAALSFTFCKAQVPAGTPIIPLNSVNDDSFNLTNNGAYFKDTDNKFDQWVGTWQYTNGNTIFKIEIQKIEGVYFPANLTHFPLPINCYMDVLIGGYYYEVNGVVISNHLAILDTLRPPLRCSGAHTTPENINIFYKEYEKAPNLSGWFVDFVLLPGSTTQATWTFDSSRKRNYSVPDNVILTKL